MWLKPRLRQQKRFQTRKEVRELEKQITQLKQKLATGAGSDLTADAVAVGDIKVLATVVDGADASTLRDTLDYCKNKLGSRRGVTCSRRWGQDLTRHRCYQRPNRQGARR